VAHEAQQGQQAQQAQQAQQGQGGELGLLAGEEEEQGLARLVRRLHEPRFESNEGRMQHRPSLETALHTILRSRTTLQWEEVLVSQRLSTALNGSLCGRSPSV
jgi:crotonobetainyl-CoA:carnitine CoA-transferase CaiB-like acyl-CoA transferase